MFILLVLTFFFSFSSYASDFTLCKLSRSYSSSLETEFFTSCRTKNGYISGQSRVEDPKYMLRSIVLPSKDPDGELLRIDFGNSVPYSFNSLYNCKTLECFENLDHWAILSKESPEFVADVISTIPNIENYDLENLYVENEVESIELNLATPLFAEPPLGIEALFTEVGDIDILEYGILDGTLSEPLLEFKEKNQEYLDHFDDVEFITDSEGNKIYPSKDSIINDQEEGLEVNIVELDDIDTQELGFEDRDSISEDEETLKFTVKDVDYVVTPISENVDGVIFEISDGTKTARFESPEYVFLEEYEDITELTFDNNSIKMESYGIVSTLDARPLSLDTELQETKIETPTLSKCLEALNTYLNNKAFSHDDIEEFLKIQSELTLHRMSWAQLNTEDPKKRLEDNILKLIKQKYQDQPEIAAEFDNINLMSRNFLAKSLPFAMDILNKQVEYGSQKNTPFLINVSDLKMIELIASFEELNENNKWDHRQFNSENLNNSIVNYATLINSAYRESKHKLRDESDISKNKNFLKSHLPKLNKKLDIKIREIIYNGCVEQEGLSCKDSADRVNEIYNSELDVIYASLINSISHYKDEDFLTNIKFGHLWPKVEK
jgi:hypothetical protein